MNVSITDLDEDEIRAIYYCTDCWALDSMDCVCDDPLEDADDPRTYGLGNGNRT
jgi:hypothetical protein